MEVEVEGAEVEVEGVQFEVKWYSLKLRGGGGGG